MAVYIIWSVVYISTSWNKWIVIEASNRFSQCLLCFKRSLNENQRTSNLKITGLSRTKMPIAAAFRIWYPQIQAHSSLRTQFCTGGLLSRIASFYHTTKKRGSQFSSTQKLRIKGNQRDFIPQHLSSISLIQSIARTPAPLSPKWLRNSFPLSEANT